MDVADTGDWSFKVEEADPLQQGLKHLLLHHLFEVAKVEEADPLQQGLKHYNGFSVSPDVVVEEADPLQQGLKPGAGAGAECPGHGRRG